jgi:carboxymethylenebutenolidase
MKTFAGVLLLFVSSLAFGQSDQPARPQIVEFPSEQLRLKGYLWKPSGVGPFPAVLLSHGSGGSDPMQTSGMSMKEAAETLAPVFVKHGYAFFYPCRRGHGLSGDQGKVHSGVLKDEEESALKFDPGVRTGQ